MASNDAFSLFGYEIKRKSDSEPDLNSFTKKVEDDGAIEIASGGVYGTYVDVEGSAKNESELITRYRDMSSFPECDIAIDDIINEMIVIDENDKVVDLNLDDLQMTEQSKQILFQEFYHLLNMLEFNRHPYDIARRWYIDGRLYYHAIIDETKPMEGIQELRYIDPRKIRKVKEYSRQQDASGLPVPVLINEYYIYNDTGFVNKKGPIYASPSSSAMNQSIKIAPDAIVMCSSGQLSSDESMVVGYLQKAVRPLNQLRTLEDSLLIYRVARAPERRIFYIDVSGLPKMKAEQYLRDTMQRFKNKLVYDSQSGEIRDDRKFMTMLEDFWFPRRDGGKSTEVITLPGGEGLGDIEDILYFQKQLYKSLNVPITRLDPETLFTLGRATEISRDEIKYGKFIRRMRTKFSVLFIKLLEKQLLLKGLMDQAEWDEIKNDIKFKFNTDNYFEELKETEIFAQRLQMLEQAEMFVGRYFSTTYNKKKILRQTDEEIEEIEEEIMEDEFAQAQNDAKMDMFKMAGQQPQKAPAKRPAAKKKTTSNK